MPERLTPNEKLARSLNALHTLQKDGRRVFESSEFDRIDRERLVENGFLQEVIRGWLISSSPAIQQGDSTPWYASFWEFCGLYCQQRFAEEWHLSPEQSLLLHAENTTVPKQMIIYSPRGNNIPVELLDGTSIYALRVPELPRNDIVQRERLRLLSPTAS